MSLSKLNHLGGRQSPPPAPELPDLCLLALFSQMSALDRVYAHQVCPQWYHRVREVNAATTKSLIISIGYSCNRHGEKSLKNIQWRINSATFGSVFADCLLSPDNHHHHNNHHSSYDSSFSHLHRLTFWNTLTLSVSQLNSATFRGHIISAFADLTALTLVSPEGYSSCIWPSPLSTFRDLLMAAKRWRRLCHLSLLGGIKYSPNEDDQEKLFACLSDLSALCYLTLENFKLPAEMFALAQLKEIRFRQYYECHRLLPLLRYGEGKREETVLKVDLFQGDIFHSELINLNDHIRSCITRLFSNDIFHDCSLPRLIERVTAFPNLTSLSMNISLSECVQIFPLIAQHLQHLLHLYLTLDFIGRRDLPDFEPVKQHPEILPRSPPPLRAQLLSVKLLELSLGLSSHSSNLQWLNLPVIMPNLQAISTTTYKCRQCNRNGVDPKTDTHRCYRDILKVLHTITGFARTQLLFCYPSSDELVPLDQLLISEQ